MVGIFVASAGPLGEVEFVKCPAGGVAPAGKFENGQAIAAVVFGSYCHVATNKKKSKSVLKLKVESTFKALTCTITVGGSTSRSSVAVVHCDGVFQLGLARTNRLSDQMNALFVDGPSDSEGFVGLHPDVKAKKAKGRSL